MQFLTCDVNTYCIGQAASMGAVLLCGGTKGKRYALPNANIMIHQLLGGAEGQASDVEIRVNYMLALKQRLNGIIAKHTGRSIEQVEKDCDRDNFMTPEEAKAYGLVDEVVQSRKEIPGLAERATSLADKNPNSPAMARPTNITLAASAANRTPRSRSSLPGRAFTSATTASSSARGPGQGTCPPKPSSSSRRSSTSPSPPRSSASLTWHCVGQDHAKKTLAVAVHNHYKRILAGAAMPSPSRGATETLTRPTRMPKSRSRRATSC